MTKVIAQVLVTLMWTLCTTLCAQQPSPSSGAEFLQFTTIAFPESNFTIAEKINNARTIVGYSTCRSQTCGFVFSESYQRINYPINTFLMGVNNRAVIVGNYDNSKLARRAFSFSDRGFRNVEIPERSLLYIQLQQVNDRGEMVGFFGTATGQHGFLLNSGILERIDFPHAANTSAIDINNKGHIVGRKRQTNPPGGKLCAVLN